MLSIRRPVPATRVLAAVAACGALLGTGCGKNRVIMNVDVLSFMNTTDTVQPYDAPAGLPFSLRLPAVPINLVEGYQDFGTAQEATLDLGLLYDNQTGQGQGQLVVYFSDDANAVYSTAPVATVSVGLTPAATTPGSLRLQLDQRMLDLFTSKHFFMGLDLVWTPATSNPLQGTCHLSQMDVHLVSQLNLF